MSSEGAPEFILASASPRRAEILRGLGIGHRVVPARIDEAQRPGEGPEAHVERLAREKARAVHLLHPSAWVLAGDTTVALGERLLEKPRDGEDAVAMLMALQGREHRVSTGLALAVPGSAGSELRSGVEITRVRFRSFDEETARGYVATGEPMDKAGAYGIQGVGSTLVEGIEGDFSGVVGLSIPLLVRLLAEAGAPYRFPASPGRSGHGDLPEDPSGEGAAFAHLMGRELAAARRQILAYPDDEAPWALLPGWPNAGGTLAHHMAGNVRHFVAAALGGEGFRRNRDGEFQDRGMSREELAAGLEAARTAVLRVLPGVPSQAFGAPVPFPPFGRADWEALGGPPTLRGFLLHLHAHAAYHLGQLDYHRRAVTGEREGVNAIDLADLPRSG